MVFPVRLPRSTWWIVAAFATLSCKKPAPDEVPAAIGEKFAFEKHAGVAWEVTVLDVEKQGKKLSRKAMLSGEATLVSLESSPPNHFERLHLRVTNRGHTEASMSPEVLTLPEGAPDARRGQAITVQTVTNDYLDPSTPAFKRGVRPGETLDYWEITEIPDASRRCVLRWGKERYVVKLGD